MRTSARRPPRAQGLATRNSCARDKPRRAPPLPRPPRPSGGAGRYVWCARSASRPRPRARRRASRRARARRPRSEPKSRGRQSSAPPRNQTRARRLSGGSARRRRAGLRCCSCCRARASGGGVRTRRTPRRAARRRARSGCPASGIADTPLRVAAGARLRRHTRRLRFREGHGRSKALRGGGLPHGAS